MGFEPSLGLAKQSMRYLYSKYPHSAECLSLGELQSRIRTNHSKQNQVLDSIKTKLANSQNILKFLAIVPT
ncbi:hypothetical protein BKH46_01475 [Helicobacter sp. 12S02634-8]|uniref:hypothetical protein n=1 Tax=Helicobacter sp. 12S02634-8 TaxID=1476199 RepID=UPI000BA59EF9|nr:hypothetical protein [Helicobacter sp. 12S02634-8]PAF48010.1 hypothetical protein BKH46_01475 [Helicobacter sp. 12S02634-8]